MGHLIRWDNAEKTVVFQQYVDVADKDDLYALAEQSAQMLNSVPHRVHIIIDEQNQKLNLNSTDIQYLEKLVPANQGAVVMVVPQSRMNYKKYVETAGKKLGPKAFEQPFYKSTVEEARQFLQEQFSLQYP